MHKNIITAYIKMWWEKGVSYMSANHVHFIGIGGISMSGIAEVLLELGYSVSGSDLKDSKLLDRLRSAGANIHIGHDKENIKGADLIVISSAVPADNPELKLARANNIIIMKRAEMIAHLMKEKRGIAISGTHGKTTTTSIVATLLKESGLDPTVLVGGVLNTIGGNAYLGHGDFFVTEADESDGSFLFFDPEIVIVTNIEMDHHDYYDSNEKLLTSFNEFINNVPANGKAIICADDKYLNKFINNNDNRIISYGIQSGEFQAKDERLYPFGSEYDLYFKGEKLGDININVPGRHNILNSLAAAAMGVYLGLDFTDLKKGLNQYQGVNRRFQKKGLIGDILVVDDYAHHPTEIIATLKAALNTGYERIIAVFQPHRYSRTQHLLEEFSSSFEVVDHLIITDIYSAGEKPIPGVSAEELARLAARNSKNTVVYIPELIDVVEYLEGIVRSRDLVLTLGAGDIYRVGEMLVDKMNKHREMA